MKAVSSTFARANLSVLLTSVANGESFIITLRGKPVARLSPVRHSAPKRLSDRTVYRASKKTVRKYPKAVITKDPKSGLPVIQSPPHARIRQITPEQVDQILLDQEIERVLPNRRKT